MTPAENKALRESMGLTPEMAGNPVGRDSAEREALGR